MKRLERSSEERIVAGVCGGIGMYFDVDPTFVRLVWIVGTLFSLGIGIIAYIVSVIIVPENKIKDDPVSTGLTGPADGSS